MWISCTDVVRTFLLLSMWHSELLNVRTSSMVRNSRNLLKSLGNGICSVSFSDWGQFFLRDVTVSPPPPTHWSSTRTHTTKTQQQNSVAWVRERTIPTEGPPLADEISAIFWG
jgi:hypothetical protein